MSDFELTQEEKALLQERRDRAAKAAADALGQETAEQRVAAVLSKPGHWSKEDRALVWAEISDLYKR